MARPTAGRRLLVIALLGFFVAGCTPPVQTTEPDEAVDRIEAAVTAFFEAYERGDADSVVSFFTEDAALLPPGAETVEGHDALRPHIASGMALGRWVQEAPTDTIVVAGRHAIHSGRYRIEFVPTENTPEGMAAFVDTGRYMIHWTNADGRWRMARYIANR